ncbi:MAG: glycosyltransferase family 2 protein [Calditrichaeota bacterium]|nr:glycosyltransferase family 2 protein [Calditrichota bacterium]MCB9368971.1 glycosyltransferase family 2 protein [Calditrichota bacterium]
MPAYNAAQTIEITLKSIPEGSVHEFILVDDCSKDDTVEVAKSLGIKVIAHETNKGYGGNQKTCYDAALASGADVVVMIHPDYQYDGRITPAVVSLLKTGTVDMILGSRIRSRRETLEGGMPIYKYISNRALTIFENIMLGQNAGDLHTGFRAYAREVLETINYHSNNDDFVFDSEFLAQAVYHRFRIGDVPIPTRYFDEASSINFRRSSKYGLLTLWVMLKFKFAQWGLLRSPLFKKSPRILDAAAAPPQ